MAISYQPRFRVTGATPWTNFGSPLTVPPFTVTITGLAQGTEYDFDVLAVSTFGSTASAIVQATTPTGVAESAEGTTITRSNLTTQVIYDSSLLQWSMTSGFQIATSPSPYTTKTTDNTTSAVTTIEYHNHTVFYENASAQWFYWSGTAWTSTLDITGPILVGGSSSPIFSTGLAGQSVGAVTVTTIGAPVFAGTFSIGGTDAAFFTISGGALVTTQTTTARTYSITITATQANTIGSPLTSNFSIVGSATSETAEGFTINVLGSASVINASEHMGVADPSGPWNTFQLTSAGAISQSINGAGVVTVGSGVVALLYHNHTLWQQTSDATYTWYYWNTTTSAYVFFFVSSLSLSGSTIASGQPASTVVGNISVVMSDGSAFSGTLAVSDTTNFKIVGTSLETKVANLSGSFSITITATPTLVGNAFVSSTIIITAGGGTAVFPNNPPPQAVANGYTTLSFFDDFTTNTINPSGSVTTIQPGFQWYAGQNKTLSDPANYHLQTTTKAAQINNGNTSGGANASPNGGILSIFGISSITNQGTICSIPAALVDNLYNGKGAGPGCYGPLGYWEGYVQLNHTNTEHFGFWTECCDWDHTTELDIFEFDSSGFTGPNWWLCNYNQWPADTVSGSTAKNVVADSEWHTFGMLLTGTVGGSGVMSAYLDNVLRGTFAIGAGTGTPTALNVARLWLLGKNFASDPINFDWVRYWSAGPQQQP